MNSMSDDVERNTATGGGKTHTASDGFGGEVTYKPDWIRMSTDSGNTVLDNEADYIIVSSEASNNTVRNNHAGDADSSSEIGYLWLGRWDADKPAAEGNIIESNVAVRLRCAGCCQRPAAVAYSLTLLLCTRVCDRTTTLEWPTRSTILRQVRRRCVSLASPASRLGAHASWRIALGNTVLNQVHLLGTINSSLTSNTGNNLHLTDDTDVHATGNFMTGDFDVISSKRINLTHNSGQLHTPNAYRAAVLTLLSTQFTRSAFPPPATSRTVTWSLCPTASLIPSSTEASPFTSWTKIPACQ